MRPPCPETQVISILAPGHPCRFTFVFFPFFLFFFFFPFFFFLRFFLSFLSFSVFPFPFLIPFSFVLSLVLSSCRFPLVSCIAFFAFIVASPLPWWRILLFCYFVSALHPPRAPCEPEVVVFPLRAVFFLALLTLTY